MYYTALFFYIITLFVQESKFALASSVDNLKENANLSATVNPKVVTTTPPEKKTESNPSSSEETEIVNFGSIQTAESLRLRTLFDYGYQDMAISEALKHLQQTPQDINIRQTLAKFYSQQKKDGLANQQLQLVELWKTWNSGNQSLAINQAIELTNKNPDNAEINYTLGYFYFTQKNYSLAGQAFELALRKDPGYTAARAALVNISIVSGNYSQATTALSQASTNAVLLDKQKPIKKYENNTLGGAAGSLAEVDSLGKIWNSGQQSEAIAQAKSYLAKNPNDIRIALALGQFYASQKKYPEAIQQYNAILTKNPTYIEAITSLSNAYVDTGNYEMADKTLEEGLVSVPENSELLLAKQNITGFRKFDSLWQLWNQNKQSEAINQAKDYIKIHPDNVQIGLSLGQFYFLQKNYPSASQQINQILVKNPDYIGARTSLIEVYLAMKEYAKATNLLQEGLKRAPSDSILLAEEQIIKDAQANRTRSTLPQVTTQKTGEALAEFNALWKLWHAGKKSLAITKASEYFKKNPDDVAVGLTLGQFYFLEKNYALALHQIHQVLTKDPNYIAARASLIEVYVALKDYAQASEILNQSLKLAPGDPILLTEKKAIEKAKNPPSATAVNVSPNVVAPNGTPAAAKNIKSLLPQSASYVEGGALYANLTNGYGHWFTQYLKTAIQKDPDNVWQAEVLHGYEFGQKADYGVVQETHNFNENWYGTLGAGISDNSIWVPKYYIGATLARRFLKSKQLVVYLQAQEYWFRPVYTLDVINPGLIYYFDKPWIVESGVYLNRSKPGSVDTAVGYLAVTQGRDKEHYVTLRLAWGREGYLPLITNSPVLGYPSIVVTGTWRQWLKQGWGWNIIAEDYHNSYYNRYSFSFGLFKEFSV